MEGPQEVEIRFPRLTGEAERRGRRDSANSEEAQFHLEQREQEELRAAQVPGPGNFWMS